MSRYAATLQSISINVAITGPSQLGWTKRLSAKCAANGQSILRLSDINNRPLKPRWYRCGFTSVAWDRRKYLKTRVSDTHSLRIRRSGRPLTSDPGRFDFCTWFCPRDNSVFFGQETTKAAAGSLCASGSHHGPEWDAGPRAKGDLVFRFAADFISERTQNRRSRLVQTGLLPR